MLCSRHPALSSIFPFVDLSGRSGRNCILSSPVPSGYNGSPDTCFSRGTTRLMSWPDGERDWRPLQSFVVSLFLSLVSTLVFSRTGGVLSHLNFLTHRFPQFPPRNLCSLVMLAVFSLCSTYLSRIGRIEKSSCSACGHSYQDTFRLILNCEATDFSRHSLFGNPLSLYDLWSRPWGVAQFLGLHGLTSCLHPSEGVR